jgi:hypothetical protein
MTPLASLQKIILIGSRGLEQHELIRRDEAERNAARLGHERPPETHHAAPGHHR